MNKAAFIDRDGVINEDRAYVYRSAEFEFIPGSIDALRALRAAGFLLVVITNQSGIARGLYTEEQYRDLERYMRDCLRQAGVTIDSVEYCPHLPDAPLAQYRRNCDCRKPRPGMILTAARALDIDLSQSILVGDRQADVEAGRAAGVGRCYLVRSGKALDDGNSLFADGEFCNLGQCVGEVLKSDD
jgi:D,D-heptose 1,7-bisphosphate phosphatase